MKRSHKIIAGLTAAASLAIGTAVFAHPGRMGPGMMGAGMGPGMMGNGMGPGMMGAGMGPGMMGRGPAAGQAAAQQLMTPEEKTAMQEKMRTAKTPEERQKIAQANFAEMQKRAKEKGITLPVPGGPGAGPHTH